MTKLTFLPLCLLVLIFFYSCDNFLSNVESSDQLAIDEVFNSIDDLEAALIGAYDIVQNGHLLGKSTLAIPDLLGHNANGVNSQISNLTITTSNKTVENLWLKAYEAINQINAILAALPGIKGQDELAAIRIEQEARFLRGVVYFELVRLFCQPYNSEKSPELGLPLILNPILEKEDIHFPERASIAEIYNQLIEDIDIALALPNFIKQSRANHYAALAYRARIAFQQEDYQMAKQLSAEIIDNDYFELTSIPQAFFSDEGEGSNEEIWVISSSPGDAIDNFGLASVYHPSAPDQTMITDDLRTSYNSIVPQMQLSPLQSEGYQVVDLRADPGILSTYSLISADTVFCNKYEGDWTGSNNDSPIARLAEFILMHAECLAREGQMEGAVIELNQIRARSLRIINADSTEILGAAANLVLFETEDFPNQQALINAIILERRIELAFEGNYFHDLMRLKRAVQGRPFDAEELRLPIPQREIDVNPNLVQNLGY